MREIKESDWKVLRRLHPIALDRFCRHVLEEVQEVSSALSETPHQRYLKAYELIQRRNDEMARVFDDLRRSGAFHHVVGMKSRGLITAEEFAEFSEEMRGVVDSFLG